MPRRSGYSGITPFQTRPYLREQQYRERQARNERDYQERERQSVNSEYYSNFTPGMTGDMNLPAVARTPIYVPFGKKDPRRHPDAQAIREAQARKYVDELVDDMRDRYTINKMMNRVLDVGLSYAVPATLDNTIDMIGDLVGMLVRLNTTLPIPANTGPWVLEGVCASTQGQGVSFTSGSYPASYGTLCLGGQAWTTQYSSLDQIPAGATAASWSHPNAANTRFTHSLVYKRVISSSRLIRNQFQPRSRFGRYRNPNAMRLVNPTPQPFNVEAAKAAEAAKNQTATQTAVVVQAAYGGATPPRLPPTLLASKSKPPPVGTKEKKGLARRIGVIGAKILDLTSESAEVVDAIYRALPKDVRKKWDRPERSADNIGQYGIGGADWKLQALYHNWHKVDVAKAIKNILVNELEDRIIGGAMAARNRATRPDRFGSNVRTEVRRRRRNRSR